MIIAVAATGPSLKDRICRQFAWCHCFVLLDGETGQIRGRWWALTGQGPQVADNAVQRLRELGVSVVVAGQFCRRTRVLFEEAGLVCRERLGRSGSLVPQPRTSPTT